MTLAEYSFLAFAVLNGARLLAYIPQMTQINRDPNGAKAVSIATWIVFCAAHIATAFYAFAAANDLIVAAVFVLNAGGCLAIVVMTSIKRLEWHRQRRWHGELANSFERGEIVRPLITTAEKMRLSQSDAAFIR